MIAEAVARENVTVEAYLEGEKQSDVRHEYFDGELFAMAGASADHELVSMNLAAALHFHLKGKPCRVFKSEMKLRMQAMGCPLFYYPDIMVACDPADNQPYYRERPKLLVEISDDENKDLVEKFYAYQRVQSVEEYVMINHNPGKRIVRISRRSDGWEPVEIVKEGEFNLRSVGLTLKFADLYAS